MLSAAWTLQWAVFELQVCPCRVLKKRGGGCRIKKIDTRYRSFASFLYYFLYMFCLMRQSGANDSCWLSNQHVLSTASKSIMVNLFCRNPSCSQFTVIVSGFYLPVCSLDGFCKRCFVFCILYLESFHRRFISLAFQACKA